MVTVTKNQATDDLENRTFTATGGNAMADEGQAQAQEQEQAQLMASIDAGASKVIFALLKMARSLVARQLPEIMEEWRDSVLKEPAEAAVPLIKKHLEKLMQVLGSNPELTVFAMSLLPLGMGYVAALERHDKTPPADVVDNVQPLHAV